MTPDGMTTDGLRAALSARLDEPARAWLEDAEARVGVDPSAIRTTFPQVSRRVGRDQIHLAGGDDDPFAPTVDDAARALLLSVLRAETAAEEMPELYRHGDARERRGILRALDVLPLDPAAADGTSERELTDTAKDLVDDALRTNDTRLVAAALGTGGVSLLDDDELAQAVLKCVFVGLDITRIPGVIDRTTPALSRMMADFVHERIAAGRTVPAAVWSIIDVHPPADALAAIQAEVDHPNPDRSAAARAALALRG